MNVFELNTAIDPETLRHWRTTMGIPSRLHRHNPRLIKASNALYGHVVKSLTTLRNKDYVKQVEKNKAIYFTPKRVDSFR
ncbi:MAG: hypothetical protein ACI4T3_04320 [Lactobacillus sp.]